MDDSVEIHTPEEVLQLPTKRKSDGSSMTKRAKTATGSGSKATEVEQSARQPSRSREPKKSMASSVSMVGRPRSDSSSGAKGSVATDHEVGSDRRQDSPRSHHSSRHVKWTSRGGAGLDTSSGCQEGERAWPTSSGGSSSRRQADSTGGPGSSRVSSRATDVWPSGSSSHSHHHHRKSTGDPRSLSSSSSRASADRKSPPGHHQDGRRESAERSGSSYVSRRELLLSPAVAQSPWWFFRRPGQNTLKNLQLKWTTQQVWRVRQRLWTAQQVTARQMTTRQVTAQQMTAQHMTGQQGDPSWSWMTSRTSWMSQRKLPTQQVNSQQETAQHSMMMTRQVWPAQHTIRTRQWTAQQLWMVWWPMVLQQGTRQLQDRTHPCCQMSAVFCSRHCQERSTRLLWLISCPCGLWCSVGWTRVWLFLMSRPGPLHGQLLLHPEMMTPHSEGPRLHLGRQTDDPGCQWVGPGHLWDGPEDWTTLQSPHVPIRPSEGLHRLIHLPEMLLLWIFRRPWTLRTRSRTGPLPTMRMKTALRRRSRQPNINCSGRLSWLPKVPSRSIPPGHAGRPGRHFWISATVKSQIGYLGWTSPVSRIPWPLWHVLPNVSRKMKRLRRQRCQRHWTPALPRSSTLLLNRSSRENHTGSRSTEMPSMYQIPPGDSGFSDSKAPSSYQMSHRMCLDTEELARSRSQKIFAFLAAGATRR